jgi:hypothetical protein
MMGLKQVKACRMCDVERIRGWFREGKLSKPRAAGMNITVDLINTLFALSDGKPARPERLRYAIQTAEHGILGWWICLEVSSAKES